jgi:Protein of unknown function (DUF1194)
MALPELTLATLRRWATPVVVMAFLCGVSASAAMAQERVDLELVLAVDISGSMDTEEAELQKQGYVAAFRHPDVIQAIQSGATGKIAVTYVEWAGPQFQQVVVPWSIVSDEATAGAFANAIAASPIRNAFGTSISSGLAFAASRFAYSGARGEREAIDVSGDGPNNMGEPVDRVRDGVLAQGIVINGLPVMVDGSVNFGPTRTGDLDVYYKDCVIGGPGSFIVPVHDLAGFGEAVRRKLVLEIAGLPPRLIRVAEVKGRTRSDCLIGERTRGNRFPRNP